jgi:hypothetical protein
MEAIKECVSAGFSLGGEENLGNNGFGLGITGLASFRQRMKIEMLLSKQTIFLGYNKGHLHASAYSFKSVHI